ncbi:Hypothetical predicted protein [Lecanosticta acicola]|uniref:Mitotic checkpoint regulator, MAD2B-interacting-domain-containing protein n=1 Tax=Lecanosticta acicola TaxID=111012 RepID=A0AAI8Z4N0_9PEZI|nr:Hypothetical predicted protein [Lecanosticta acicola]
MALVNYSDSESESESPATAPATAPKTTSTSKSAFHKAAPGKIQVDLPSFKPEPGQAENGGADGPPTKRARTSGAFSGFNSLLPAPKRAAQKAPKTGVSLKTSSEAAFSRERPAVPEYNNEPSVASTGPALQDEQKDTAREEPKLVGKATRFLPLSVANKKKKKPISKPTPVAELSKSTDSGQHSNMAKAVTEKVAREAEAMPKPKRSLFSMQQEEDPVPIQASGGQYEPLLAQKGPAYLPEEVEQPATQHHTLQQGNANSLEATADDLNLTPAQRRQLFGRKGGKDAQVTHFNMEAEYTSNEQMRQNGEVVEHRNVKAIAPGKHSLQQLVNNARTQGDALEDKWAEGRKNKGSMR